MSKDYSTNYIPSPDGVMFVDNGESLMRLPHSRDVELLLSDRMVDEIGRALEDYTSFNPIASVCPSPRTESPWPFVPVLTSLSSSSTLISSSDSSSPTSEHLMLKPTKKRKIRPSKPTPVQPTSRLANSVTNTSIGSATDSSLDETDVDMDMPKPIKKKRTKLVDPNKPISERSRKSSSTFRGVSLCTKDSRWQARIRIKKEVVYLGRFETEEAAARRYDEAARLHHGDKALINFITNDDRVLGRRSVFEQAGGKSARA